jgi:hypothetical protein
MMTRGQAVRTEIPPVSGIRVIAHHLNSNGMTAIECEEMKPLKTFSAIKPTLWS